jgi:RimJ/RimL family protein N-acetyltransferase
MGLVAEPLRSSEICLTPLAVGDAEELAPVLADAALHRFIGGEPPDLAEVRSRFARQCEGASPDGREVWLNWVMRTGAARHAAGTVQATVTESEGGRVAELAWVIGTAYQGHGLAKAAARLVARWLSQHGVQHLRAYIHPDHRASQAVAASLGLRPTDYMSEGERRWQRSV